MEEDPRPSFLIDHRQLIKARTDDDDRPSQSLQTPPSLLDPPPPPTHYTRVLHMGEGGSSSYGRNLILVLSQTFYNEECV